MTIPGWGLSARRWCQRSPTSIRRHSDLRRWGMKKSLFSTNISVHRVSSTVRSTVTCCKQQCRRAVASWWHSSMVAVSGGVSWSQETDDAAPRISDEASHGFSATAELVGRYLSVFGLAIGDCCYFISGCWSLPPTKLSCRRRLSPVLI